MVELAVENFFVIGGEVDDTVDTQCYLDDSEMKVQNASSDYDTDLIQPSKPFCDRNSVHARIDENNVLTVVSGTENCEIQRPKLSREFENGCRIRSMILSEDNLSVKENINGEYKEMYSEPFYNPVVNSTKRRRTFKKRKKLVSQKTSRDQCDCRCDFNLMHKNLTKNGSDSSSDFKLKASKKCDPWSVEKRRQSILQKLLMSSESTITQEEEEDISERAENYALTIAPDERYFILPNDIQSIACDERNKVNKKSVMRSDKKRKPCNNIQCFVKCSESANISDTSYILPHGTKLLKPTDKLIEMVAEAIEASPDHMLQVHQIYIYLQNKYPFFRYMGKGNIVSWRSSIRHALYQKWFKKIKLESYSNYKGCYWTLNPDVTHGFSNKINSLLSDFMNGLSDCTVDFLSQAKQNQPECSILPELTLDAPDYNDFDDLNNKFASDLEDIFSIARECGISVTDSEVEDIRDLEIPRPLLDADPLLSEYGNTQSQADIELQEAVDKVTKSLTDNSSLSQTSTFDTLLVDSLLNTPESKSAGCFADRRGPSPLFSSPESEPTLGFYSPILSNNLSVCDMSRSAVSISPVISSAGSSLHQSTSDEDFSLMESQVITLLPGQFYVKPTVNGQKTLLLFQDKLGEELKSEKNFGSTILKLDQV